MRMFLLVMYRIGRDRMYYCSFEHFEHAHYWRNQASVVGYYTLLLDVDMSHVMPPVGQCIDGDMGGCVWPGCNDGGIFSFIAAYAFHEFGGCVCI